MLPTCHDMTSGIVSFFSGCFKLSASVSPVTIPTLPPENPAAVVEQPVEQAVVVDPNAVPQDPEHPEAAEIQSDPPTQNQGVVSSSAPTARVVEPPQEHAAVHNTPGPSQPAQQLPPNCSDNHLRWLVNNDMYNGPLPEGFVLEPPKEVKKR